ncbi:MAG: type II secretion system GspH family protein [Acidobacteria bacterium]|nr:type II secretion system GspH family protein [Acidobacteriota bacterium]MCG2816998.1 type II secretion system GspH family protein [Candidatus Aminicenantes bacterium]MBU1339595.1 type II secretion system GspH family protein [Acidobacteriota bacterium]MBU1473361.1 type II secretion system GspH family protein [Acidobacteriota bacterium]MBU4255409.1 type II secretion system GspH family protein [Acidobacteriota bacterium]
MTTKEKGFTVLELIIVFTLIGILVGLALPQFKHAIIKSKETVLKENLFQLRMLINQYYTDKKHYPASLQSLVDDKYLFRIPVDPITNSSDTWIEVPETLSDESVFSGQIPGIVDLTSGSKDTAQDGTLYSTW